MRRTLFKVHTWMALATCIPLLIVCLTGSVLMFKHEIDSLIMPDKVRVDGALHARLSLDTLRSNIAAIYPKHEQVGWVLFLDPGRADLVYVIPHGSSERKYLLLNQYSGEILAPPVAFDEYLTDWLLELHFTFLLGDLGLLASTLVALMFFVLGITGLILYRQFWVQFFTLRWNKSMRVYFSDIHKMVGVIGAPIFILLAVTGGYWNVLHLTHEVQEALAGVEHHVVTGPMMGPTISLDTLHAQSEQQLPGFVATYLSLPFEPDGDVYIYGEVPQGNPLLSQYASHIRFDAQYGHYVEAEDVRSEGFLHKLDDSVRRLHFGNFAGVWSRSFWCFIGLLPLLLSITGIYLWAKRRRKKKISQRKRRSKTGYKPSPNTGAG